MAAALQPAIKAAMLAAWPAPSTPPWNSPANVASYEAGQDGFAAALAHGVANALCTYLVTAVQVVPTALVAPSGGGPVTGTGTIL